MLDPVHLNVAVALKASFIRKELGVETFFLSMLCSTWLPQCSL